MKEINKESVVINHDIEKINTGMISIGYADKSSISCKFCVGDEIKLYIAVKNTYVEKCVIIKDIIIDDLEPVYITNDNERINKAYINNLIYIYNNTNIHYNYEMKNTIIITDPITGNDTGDIDNPSGNNNPNKNLSIKNKGVGNHLLDVSEENNGLYYIKGLIGKDGVSIESNNNDLSISVGVDMTEDETKKLINKLWGDFK